MRSRYEEALVELQEMKRALAERARRVGELEQRLMRQAEHGSAQRGSGRRPVGGPDESDLARAVAAAEAEKALAQAEREKLDERERSIRKVERELAGQRMQLEDERRRLGMTGPAQPPPGTPAPEGEPGPPTPLPQPPPEPDLEPAATARRRGSRRR